MSHRWVKPLVPAYLHFALQMGQSHLRTYMVQQPTLAYLQNRIFATLSMKRFPIFEGIVGKFAFRPFKS